MSPDTSKHIADLRPLFESIKLSEILKVHVILEHIEHCLSFIENGLGLGVVSEQAGESIHREFLKYWEWYKIKILSDASYGD